MARRHPGPELRSVLRDLPDPLHRILIVRLGAIGDVARVLPMLHGLRERFPQAEVDWVVQTKAADLLREHPEIDHLWVVPFAKWREALTPAAWRLRRAMRARDYELVVDFQGMFKGAVWALAAGGRAVRVGWAPGHAQNLAWLWYHGLRTPPAKRVNRHVRHRVLVDWLGVADALPRPLPRTPAVVEPVDRFAAELESRDMPRPWVFTWPGSSGKGSHRRWNPDHLRTTLEEIHRRTGGTVIVGWGPVEAEEARALAHSLEGAALAPPTTIRQLVHLLSRCDLYVGIDSAPMHLAALAGTPVVGVYGRSDPVIHGPAPYLERRVVAGPEAREWKTRERQGLPPSPTPEPEAVVEAALELLERRATPKR